MQLSTRRIDDISEPFHLYNDLAAFAQRQLKPPFQAPEPSKGPYQPRAFIVLAWNEALRHYLFERQKGLNDLPPWSDDALDRLLKRGFHRMMTESLLPPCSGPSAAEWDEAKAVINEFGPVFFPLIRESGVCVQNARLIPKYKFPSAWRSEPTNMCEIMAETDIISHDRLNASHPTTKALQRVIRAVLPVNSPFEIVVVYKGRRRPLFHGADALDVNTQWNIDKCCLHYLAYLRQQQNPPVPVIGAMIVYLNELCPTLEALSRFFVEVQNGATDIIPFSDGDLERALRGWANLPKIMRARANFPQMPLVFRLNRAVRLFRITPQTMKQAMKRLDDVVIGLKVHRSQFIHRQSWGWG